MKLTNEQLTQMIREELEQVLEGPKYSIADKEKKIGMIGLERRVVKIGLKQWNY